MDDKTMIVVRAFRGLDKEAEGASCPGGKLRSEGMGRGMGVGKGKGPVASDGKPNKPIGRATAMKYGWKDPKTKKKAVITKESLAKNSVDDGIEVEVTRIPSENIKLAGSAIDALVAQQDAAKNDPMKQRPSGVTNLDVARVGVMRSAKKAENRKQQQLAQLGNLFEPKTAFSKRAIMDPMHDMNPELKQRLRMQRIGETISGLGSLFGKRPEQQDGAAEQSVVAPKPDIMQTLGKLVSGLRVPVAYAKGASVKAAEGGQAGAQDPYSAFQQMVEDGKTVSKAIPGLDPSVVLQGRQQGVDMSPGAIKKRLGAHEMISRGKKILRDDNKNGVPDAAEASMGGNPAMMAQLQGQMPGQPQPQSQPKQPPMVAAAKLRTPSMTKAGAGMLGPGGLWLGLMNLLKSRPGREVPAGPEGGRKFMYDKPITMNFPTAEAKQRFLSRVKTAARTKNSMPLDLTKTSRVVARGGDKAYVQLTPENFQKYLPMLRRQMARNAARGQQGLETYGSMADVLKAQPAGASGKFKNPMTIYMPSAEAKQRLLSSGTKTLSKRASPTAQNTEDDDEGDETKPGIEFLALAADEPVKKAPAKKPEEESENEAEIKGDGKGAKKEADVKSQFAGLGLRALGQMSRLGSVPLRYGGKGLEAVGRKIHGVGPLARVGTSIEGAGTKTKELGRLGKLTGKLMRRMGKQVQAGKLGVGESSPARGGMRFMKEVPIRTSAMPPVESSLGRKVYQLTESGTPKELVGRSLDENLRRVAEKFGIKGGDMSTSEALKLMGPSLLGMGMATGGAELLLGGGSKKEAPKAEGGEKSEKKDEGEKKASMGSGVVPQESSNELPRRDGFKTTNRQQVYEDLSKWSLGARA